MLFLKLYFRGIARFLMVGGFGIGLAGVVIGILELWFVSAAVAVTATVEDTGLECSVRWEGRDEGGKRTTYRSERMVCMAADILVRTEARPKIRLVEHRRTLLVYTAPDGRLVRRWSDLSKYEGRRLESGDTVPLMVAADDPLDFRPVRGYRDLRVLAGMILGGFAVGAGGWFIRRRVTV